VSLGGGWALVKGLWLSWMQYRSFFFILAFGWMIPPLIYLLVWSTAAGDGRISGFSRGEFVAYYLILILVNQLTYAQTNWTLGDLIRSGQLSRVLLRPIPAIFDALAAEFAGKVVYLAFDLPVVALLAIVLRPELDFQLVNGLLFLPALALAWALRFFWGCWLALLAFWTTRADALLSLQDTLMFLLAGQVAPVALLPGVLQEAARVLPFRSMVAFPVEVLSGRLAPAEILAGFGIQAAWLAVALGLYAVLWRAGLRRYAAVGG
jgi:ABC-2 type transport system permease protein